MKFLTSEGRVICLVDRDDANLVSSGEVFKIDLLIIPEHHRQHLENSHMWNWLFPRVKNGYKNIIYF